MDFRQVPLALALALAIAAVGSGCAGDGQLPPEAATGAAGAPAVQSDPHGSGDPHAQDDHGQHALAGMDFPVADGHTPWMPDAPLLEGMSRIRAAIAGLEGRPGPATVATRAAEVDAAIEYMFANCRLDPEPDIALHAILARLMAATRALQADPADLAPVAGMHAAIANYEALFDDPPG